MRFYTLFLGFFLVLSWSFSGLSSSFARASITSLDFFQERIQLVCGDTGEPISFAHIYFESEGENRGVTAANLNGFFRIPDGLLTDFSETKKLNLQLRITAIGYESLHISLDEIMLNSSEERITLQLRPVLFEREAATVSAARQKSGRLTNSSFWWRMGINQFSSGGFHARPTTYVSYSMAQLVDLEDKQNIWLDAAEIRISSISHIDNVRFSMNRSSNRERERVRPQPDDEFWLRFRLVKPDEQGYPSELDYLPEPIYLKVPVSSQKLSFDLSDYNLAVSEPFFVVIDLLVDDPESYHGFMPLFGSRKTKSGAFSRMSIAGDWRKRDHVMVYDIDVYYD
ncbi:MAG: hypothetical protein LAT67_11485 [Balneolales bacterium]|nr:hypothetical protein [Balneolales bacterium]